MGGWTRMRGIAAGWVAIAAVSAAMPASAQVRTIDPNRAIDADPAGTPAVRAREQSYRQPSATPVDQSPPVVPPPAKSPSGTETRAAATTVAADTYERDDLLAAGEGVFGKGAEGLAGIIEKILKDQGRPNAYIAGREAAGAFIVGLRYGSGVMSHKVEGQQPVYWTGPSLGFDVGGDADKVFVLVYNLYDTEELFHRFPGAEGRLYAIGGFAATYLRRGKVVLIPIRLGTAGARGSTSAT